MASACEYGTHLFGGVFLDAGLFLDQGTLKDRPRIKACVIGPPETPQRSPPLLPVRRIRWARKTKISQFQSVSE
jgi:hypothetical protein